MTSPYRTSFMAPPPGTTQTTQQRPIDWTRFASALGQQGTQYVDPRPAINIGTGTTSLGGTTTGTTGGTTTGTNTGSTTTGQSPYGTFGAGAGNNLIASQFNPYTSSQLGQVQNQTMQAAQNVGQFQMPQLQGVSSSMYPQYTQNANNLLGQSGMAAQNMGNLQQFGSIAPTQAQSLAPAWASAQNMGNLQQFGPIGTTSQSGAQRYLQPAASELGNAQIGQYGQIMGSQDPRIAQLEQQQQQAILNAGPGQFNAIGGGTYEQSPEAQRARQLTAQATESLAGAPSRQELALQALRTFDAEQGDIQQLGIQDIGRAGARLGRLGSGMVTTDLGNLKDRLNTTRERMLSDLAQQTASQELGDRLSALSALSGVGGQFNVEDLATGGMQQGLREEQRGERAASLANQALGSGIGLQQAGALGGLASDIYGREAGLRAEDRGERNFQYGTDVDAANLALQRLGAGQSLAGQQFGMDTQGTQQQMSDRDFLAQQALAQSGVQGQQAGLFSGLAGQQFGMGQAQTAEQMSDRDFLAQQALARSGVQGQQAGLLSGLAGQQFGMGQGLRAEDAAQQAFQSQQAQNQMANLLAQQNAGQSLQEQLYGQGAADRGEMRTERDYQQFMQQQALQNALLENTTGFGQNMDIARLLASLSGVTGSGATQGYLLNLLQQQAGGTTGGTYDWAKAFGNTGGTTSTGTGIPGYDPYTGTGVDTGTNPFGEWRPDTGTGVDTGTNPFGEWRPGYVLNPLTGKWEAPSGNE